MNPRPYEPPVRGDVDLGNAQLDRLQQLSLGDTAGCGIQLAARTVNALDFVALYGRPAVEHERKAAKVALDRRQPVQSQPLLSRKFVGSMASLLSH